MGSAANDDAIKVRLASMSVEELRRAVTAERDDYVPRALVLAEEELARRNGAALEATTVSEDEEEAGGGADPVDGLTSRTRWWDGWVAVVAAASVVNVLGAVAVGASTGSIFRRIIWACCVLPLVSWLRRRSRTSR